MGGEIPAFFANVITFNRIVMGQPIFCTVCCLLRPDARLLGFAFIWLISPVFAQNMSISEGLSIRNDYGYEIIGRLRDRILLFRDKYDDFEVQAYDNQMHPVWNKELEGLEKRGIQIIAVLGGKNDFSIVYKLRRRGYTTLKVHKYDPGASLIDTMTVKDYGDRIFNAPNLAYISSDDKNCVAVYNTIEPGKIEITCFRLDKMQVLWDKIFLFESNFDEANGQAMTLGNNGEFFLVHEKNNRKSRIEEHQYEIIFVNTMGEKRVVVRMPDFLTGDTHFVYDNLNHRLVGAGLYAEKNRDRVNGTFYLSVAAHDASNNTLRYEPFDDKLISILRRKDVADDTKGITDATINQLVLRQDGGVLLVAERKHEIMRGAAAGRGFWRDGMRMVVDYYYDDFFLVAMQPNGQAQWKTVLHKKQYSQDDDGTFSSFFTLRSSDALRFLFNDEIKYENTCSEYVISPLGDFDRNNLLNTEGQNLRLRFRDALQISTSECLVPSEFRNKLRLVLLQY